MLPITYGNILAVFFRATDLETINSILQAEYSAAQIQAITWLTWRRITKEGNK
jgi:hypothetical protein